MKNFFITLLFIVLILGSTQTTFAAYTTNGLVVSLNLDENSGTGAVDSSGNGNAGNVVGGPTWSGGNITLDGANDKISIAHNSQVSSSNHSYEIWYTMPSSANWSAMTVTTPRLVDKTPTTSLTGSSLLITKATRKVTFFLGGTTWGSVTAGTASTASLSGSTALVYGTNYHIVLTYNDVTKVGRIYVNGVLDAEAISSISYIPNTLNIAVGGRPEDNLRNAPGVVNRVSAYNKELSSLEIAANYAEGADYNHLYAPDPTIISASLSTVTASSSSVFISSGTVTSTITVTARNLLGDGLSGKTVTLTSNRADDVITPSSAVTNGSGIAVFTVSSPTIGSSTITASIQGTVSVNTAAITFLSPYVTQTGVNYVSTLDTLNLKMDVAYDGSITNAPIVIDLHGYNGPYPGQDIIQRLSRKGVFAIKTYKRGYGGSQGTQDDSAREVHDFYDAIEYVKTNYAGYVDPDNINIIGYSGGGGNTFGLVTKFPDYFRSANIFFGMSDYGYDPVHSWWYNGALTGNYRTGMQSYIGGTPLAVPDNYYARAHYLGARNNPYTHLQLFWDVSETIVPMSHSTQFVNNYNDAGFSNLVMRTSDATTTINETADVFSSGLTDYSILGNSSVYTWNPSGHLDWTTDRSTLFSSVYKKFTSLRKYDKTDHIKASFDLSLASTDSTSSALFGFRDSADTSLKTAVSIIVGDRTPYVRVDYTTGVRDITAFTTALALNTTYKFDLELDNSLVTAVLKDAAGTVIETKTVSINGTKTFGQVDSFAVYNFADGNFPSSLATGTLDNVVVDAYARYIHGYPQEGEGTSEGNITAENFFVADMIAGTWTLPPLSTTGSMFIPGYIKTKKFQVFLGTGRDEAGNMTYDITGNASSLATKKRYTVEGLTGSADIELKVYELTPSVQYNVKDTNITDGGSTLSQVTTDSSGTLSFTGTLGSTHQYDIFQGVDDTSGPVISSVSSNTPGEVSATITWTTDEASTSQVDYGSTSAYGSSTTPDAVLTTSHSVAVPSLSACTTYHYRVRSSDPAGNESVSGDGSLTTSGCLTAPGAPTSVTAVGGNSSAQISFTAPSDGGSAITGYTVTSSPGGITATGSVSPITVTGLSNGTAYTFAVIATNGIGDSTSSSSSNSVTPAAPGDITPPVISSVSSNTPGEVSATITWTTDEASTSQVDYGSTSAYGSSTTPDAVLTTSHSVAVPSLSACTTYHYRVRSSDPAGNESVSGDGSLTTSGCLVPSNSTQTSYGGTTTGFHSLSTLSPISSLNSLQPPTFITVLRQGAKGQQVLSLQKYLNQYGIPTSMDGVFGSKTRASVIRFQQNKGLVADGIAGSKTFSRMK